MSGYAFGDEKCLCIRSMGDVAGCPVHPPTSLPAGCPGADACDAYTDEHGCICPQPMSDLVDRIAAALLAWPPHPPMAEGTARQMAQRVAADLQLTEERRVTVGWARQPVSVKVTAPLSDATKDERRFVSKWFEVQP